MFCCANKTQESMYMLLFFANYAMRINTNNLATNLVCCAYIALKKHEICRIWLTVYMVI